MPISKKWDSKNKCWRINRTEANVKAIAHNFLKAVPGVGWLLAGISKEVLRSKLISKNYCKSDVTWLLNKMK